jgi:hypothetical protein
LSVNVLISLFLNTSIRRKAQINVTSKTPLLDVWRVYVGEQADLFGENLVGSLQLAVGSSQSAVGGSS